MKKELLLIFCIAVLVFSVPIFVHAQTGTSTASTSTIPILTNPPSSIGEIGNTEVSFIGPPVKWLMYLALVIESFFIMIAGMLVGVALQFNMSILNFDPPFITVGWQIFRDIANLGFVVGIVIIAVSTILRIKGYEAKQILWKLIVAALVVNFSLLVGGVIIQPANSISKFLLNYIGSGDYASAAKIGDAMRFVDLMNSGGLVGGVDGELVGWLTGGLLGESTTFFILAAMAVLLVFGLVMFLTLISFAGMLFVRYFYLAFLLMISPVVWLLWIFPQTKEYFKEWWKKFIHWTIFAPFMLLFLYIALLVLDKYPRNVSNLASGIPGSGELGIDFGLLVTGLFAVAILIGGLKMAAKMGHGGTALALGTVDKGSKWAKKWASDRVKRTGAATLQAPGKVAQKFGYKPGTIQSKLFKAGAWGKTTKPFFSNKKKGIEGQTLTEKTGTVLRSVLLGPTQAIARETGIAMGQVSTKLKKTRAESVDDEKKRLRDLSKDQQDAAMGSLNTVQRAAVLELQAKNNEINEKTLSAFKTADEKRNAMIKILERMDRDKRSGIKDIEKRIGMNKDMLIAQRDGSAITYTRDKDDPTKIIKEKKTFDELAKSFFVKYSADDWKSFSSNLGSKMYGDSPSHLLDSSDDNSTLKSIDPIIMDQLTDPGSSAFQSVMSRLSSKQQNLLYKRVEDEIAKRVGDGRMTEGEKNRMTDKMDKVRKHLSTFISPDKNKGNDDDDIKKTK